MKNLIDIVKNHLPEGIVLMDLVQDSKHDFIKITIDSLKDILIEETSKIAKRIKNDKNFLLMFPSGCRIEVGTPGVGSNMLEKFQYKKNIGRKIFVEYRDNYLNVNSEVFRLIDVEKEGVRVVGKKKQDSLILFENIVSARVKVSFD